jgi:isopentenyldiphosphate isomerase
MTPHRASRRSSPSDDGESPDEVLACVGLNGRIFPFRRDRAHGQGIHHLVVRVLAFDSRGRYLVQRRAESKRSCPGYYTDSASGHVSFSIGLLFDPVGAMEMEAIRELEEEVGLSPERDENGPVIKPFSVPRDSPPAFETSHCLVALVEGAPRPSEEVDPENTCFVDRDRLTIMLKNEKFVPVAKMYWEELLAQVGSENPRQVIFGS